MQIAVSILMLLLFGAVVMVPLMFFVKILYEGTVEIMALAIKQSTQWERENGKIATKHNSKVTKMEMQIEDILKIQHF